jgi:upstream activation factor subunit UAF30
VAARGGRRRKHRPRSRPKSTKYPMPFSTPFGVTRDLAAVVGEGPMPRVEVIKKLWIYIRKNSLQDSDNKRNINADRRLKKVFGGKNAVNMMEMIRLVWKHLVKV